MCQLTYFTYEHLAPCDDKPPRPARIHKCPLAQRRLDCTNRYTRCELKCPYCQAGVDMQTRIDNKRRWMTSQNPKGKAPELTNNDVDVDVDTNDSSGTIPIPIPTGETHAGPSSHSTPVHHAPVNNIDDTHINPMANLTIAKTWPLASNTPKRNTPPIIPKWEVPTRCFLDPGYQRHDPFLADRIKLAYSRGISVPPGLFDEYTWKINTNVRQCVEPDELSPGTRDPSVPIVPIVPSVPSAPQKKSSLAALRQKFHNIRDDIRELKLFRLSSGSSSSSAAPSGSSNGSSSSVETQALPPPPSLPQPQSPPQPTVQLRYLLDTCCAEKNRLKRFYGETCYHGSDVKGKDIFCDDFCTSSF